MSMSIKDVTKIVSGRMLAITIAGMLALPVAAYSQDQEEGTTTPDVEAVTPSVTPNSGPWQNSAGSTIGTREGGAASTQRADPRLGPGGGTLGRGPVTTAGGPGGNPDVPFDSNMNFAFLIAGIVLAFTVVRKQWKLRTVPVENK